jgi:hypothetical protein
MAKLDPVMRSALAMPPRMYRRHLERPSTTNKQRQGQQARGSNARDEEKIRELE